MRAVVTAGEAHVARWPDAAAVIGPPGSAADALVGALDALGSRDVDSVRALLGASPDEVSASVVLLRPPPETSHPVLVSGTGIVTHGGATIAADGDGVAEGDASGTPIVLAVDATTAAAAGGIGDLRTGIVAGSALTLLPDPREASPVAEAAALDTDRPADDATPGDTLVFEPQTTGEFTFVDVRNTGATVRRAPLPVAAAPDPEAPLETTVFSQPAQTDEDRPATEVFGILCARQHFNHPHARYCNRCGLSMLQLTHNLIAAPRPTLGFLVFDDGATWAIDRSYLIGRDPTAPTSTALDRLGVSGDASTVSIDHAEVRLENWDVTLVDLGSTNGTFVWDAATHRWERLAPRRPVTIAPGATAAVGHRTFVYESALLR
ncbi:MAG: FHA domain-containing protein [Acidimicrobiales bacterium]